MPRAMKFAANAHPVAKVVVKAAVKVAESAANAVAKADVNAAIVVASAARVTQPPAMHSAPNPKSWPPKVNKPICPLKVVRQAKTRASAVSADRAIATGVTAGTAQAKDARKTLAK